MAGRRPHRETSPARSRWANFSVDDRGRPCQRREGRSFQLPNQPAGLVRALRTGGE